MTSNSMRGWVVWVAQGLGVGRIPKAPGTCGSLLGLGLLGLLLLCGSLLTFAVMLGVLAIASVWVCGEAERRLGERDPSSVVLDEIVAVPLCYLIWLVTGSEVSSAGSSNWPAFTDLAFTASGLPMGVLWLAFRFFDIVKPWPVYQTQRFPAGWGIVADDLVAALYVNGVWWAGAQLGWWPAGWG